MHAKLSKPGVVTHPILSGWLSEYGMAEQSDRLVIP
jgi:hypothetical protein